jgi:2-C-methyl-D-erythritol 4-phosphate cytidylyltransferase
MWYAARALAGDARIDTVFVVLAAGDERFSRCDWSALGERVAPLFCGGPTRAVSVYNGLVALGSVLDLDDWVLVHDAARPCLAAADLARLIDALRDDEVGGLLAAPVADTLKRSDEAGRVLATESRERLWRAQTPQMFRYGALVCALANAGEVTDESAAIESLGLRPRLVAGSSGNLKVTYADDLALATTLLGDRR